MKTRPLKPNEEQEILDWCHANPRASNFDAMIVYWRGKYNCSEFSIMKLFVRENIIKLNSLITKP